MPGSGLLGCVDRGVVRPGAKMEAGAVGGEAGADHFRGGSEARRWPRSQTSDCFLSRNSAGAVPGWHFNIMSTSFYLSRRAPKPAAHSGMSCRQDRLFIALAKLAKRCNRSVWRLKSKDIHPFKQNMRRNREALGRRLRPKGDLFFSRSSSSLATATPALATATPAPLIQSPTNSGCRL